MRSRVFPGLWVDARALLGPNVQPVLAVLQLGLDAAKHQNFVENLARAIERRSQE